MLAMGPGPLHATGFGGERVRGERLGQGGADPTLPAVGPDHHLEHVRSVVLALDDDAGPGEQSRVGSRVGPGVGDAQRSPTRGLGGG